jgi:hypothetical protein
MASISALLRGPIARLLSSLWEPLARLLSALFSTMDSGHLRPVVPRPAMRAPLAPAHLPMAVRQWVLALSPVP